MKDKDIYCLIKQRLDSGGEAELIVTGNSMYPLFKDGGTIVTLSPVKNKLKKYDIALYMRENGAVVLHRYVGKNGDMLCFRGDNEHYTEKSVKADKVCGVATIAKYNNKTLKLCTVKQRFYGAWLSVRYNTMRLLRAMKRRLLRIK